MGVTLRLKSAFQMEFPVINIALVEKKEKPRLVIFCLPCINTLHHLHRLSNVLLPFL